MSKKYYRVMFWAGFIIWLLGSWIGGWQDVATTQLEKYTDLIGAVFMLYGGLGDVLMGMTINKDDSTVINGNDIHMKIPDKSQISIAPKPNQKEE